MTPDQLAYLARRRRQIRYWPFMAGMLLALLVAAYGWLFLKAPIYVSPMAFVQQLQGRQLGLDQLATLAALGNLAFIACGLFILALIGVASLALWNEHRLILMLDAMMSTPATSPEFKDYFSVLAEDYASYRPHYPTTLFAELARVSATHERAWDCATGNGQAAAGLAAHFQEVLATDASSAQIAAAQGPANVRFAVAPADASGLPDAAVDLVLVAQAAHWFDLPAFYAEVERVLRPGGVLALLTYSGVRINESLDPLLREFHQVTVGPYWPPERAHVENDYRELPFPWPEIPFPAQTMTAHWTLDQLMGYLGTWSATARYRQERGEDPLPALRACLEPLWGDAAMTHEVNWPLPLRIGRRP